MWLYIKLPKTLPEEKLALEVGRSQDVENKIAEGRLAALLVSDSSSKSCQPQGCGGVATDLSQLDLLISFAQTC